MKSQRNLPERVQNVLIYHEREMTESGLTKTNIRSEKRRFMFVTTTSCKNSQFKFEDILQVKARNISS